MQYKSWSDWQGKHKSRRGHSKQYTLYTRFSDGDELLSTFDMLRSFDLLPWSGRIVTHCQRGSTYSLVEQTRLLNKTTFIQSAFYLSTIYSETVSETNFQFVLLKIRLNQSRNLRTCRSTIKVVLPYLNLTSLTENLRAQNLRFPIFPVGGLEEEAALIETFRWWFGIISCFRSLITSANVSTLITTYANDKILPNNLTR